MNIEKKKYKQNRIFDVLFNPRKRKLILIFIFLLTLLEIILFFSEKDHFQEKPFGHRIIEWLIILFILFLELFFYSPKCFYFDGKTIEFYNYRDIRKSRDGSIKISFVIRRGNILKRENFVLSELENIEFSQNSIERSFNTGRISFCGRGICTSNNKTYNITHNEKFTLYGIKDFSDFKSEFLQKHT